MKHRDELKKFEHDLKRAAWTLSELKRMSKNARKATNMEQKRELLCTLYDFMGEQYSSTPGLLIRIDLPMGDVDQQINDISEALEMFG